VTVLNPIVANRFANYSAIEDRCGRCRSIDGIQSAGALHPMGCAKVLLNPSAFTCPRHRGSIFTSVQNQNRAFMRHKAQLQLPVGERPSRSAKSHIESCGECYTSFM
jgi:hypothetical protein